MNKAVTKVIIRELKGFEQIKTIFPLISQLNPDIDETTFLERIRIMLREGYRCIVAEEAGVLLGCTGFWVGTRLWCGTYMEPDNLVINREHRGRGIGEKLMKWLEEEGRKQHCQIVKLEAYTTNISARSFYARLAYTEPGFVIVKPLLIDAEEWNDKLKKRAK